jgi:RNA polymerase sigma factor (sigma-70 family)
LPWLYAVARNQWRNHRRKLGRRAETALEQRHVDLVDHDGGLGLSELQMDVARAGSRLPAVAWVGLTLRFAHGFADHEIADILGISQANVRKMRSRSVQKLRRALEDADRRVGGPAVAGHRMAARPRGEG